ncbi:hypothetical protein ZIOFF_046923 [Zingiber officinale]|uniref:Uncharacterized protein n=1 Tax=Zingiber officinale TaxID=94328 RepID=A0A8J5FU32_ZINOF|nr:hypothetical protein ZIOFF_046923 [Zingiber officinale]
MLGLNSKSFSFFATAIPAFTLLVQADCSIWNMKVDQKTMGWLPEGRIPVYNVSVRNTCDIRGGCALANVHMTCGDFNTSLPVDPDIFRYLSFNDCLLVGGRSIQMGSVASFLYAHSKPYPMTISSVTCFPRIPKIRLNSL